LCFAWDVLLCHAGSTRLVLLKAKLWFLIWTVAILSCAAADNDYTRTEDVIYGRKHGTALTLDVFTPARANGCGVLVLISGGWFSSHDAINPAFFKSLLEHGYTVFAVVHGSQPKFTIPEIVQDIHRAVRFVRANADRFGIAPDKLGMTGASAGGHLSLTMAVKGGPGNAMAKDAVERQSSEVQAVACFFPPTDFLNYGEAGEEAVGIGRLKNFKAAFGGDMPDVEKRREFGREISPIYFVRSNQPPVLILHGDADKLVPLRQAQTFVEKSRQAGAIARLDVREGKLHGWAGMDKDMGIFADWFDEHLRKSR